MNMKCKVSKKQMTIQRLSHSTSAIFYAKQQPNTTIMHITSNSCMYMINSFNALKVGTFCQYMIITIINRENRNEIFKLSFILFFFVCQTETQQGVIFLLLYFACAFKINITGFFYEYEKFDQHRTGTKKFQYTYHLD